MLVPCDQLGCWSACVCSGAACWWLGVAPGSRSPPLPGAPYRYTPATATHLCSPLPRRSCPLSCGAPRTLCWPTCRPRSCRQGLLGGSRRCLRSSRRSRDAGSMHGLVMCSQKGCEVPLCPPALAWCALPPQDIVVEPSQLQRTLYQEFQESQVRRAPWALCCELGLGGRRGWPGGRGVAQCSGCVCM